MLFGGDPKNLPSRVQTSDDEIIFLISVFILSLVAVIVLYFKDAKKNNNE